VIAHHILIPIHDFSAGGTELVAFRLARAWVAAGRRVSLLAGAHDGPLRPRVPDNVAVQVLSPERPRATFSRLNLGARMAMDAVRHAPDAIFIPGNFHFMLGRGLRAALPHAAIVAKASNPVWGSPPAPLMIARTLVGAVTRGIDRVIAMAPALAPDVARFVGERRVAVIADPFLDDDMPIAARPAGRPAGAVLNLLMVARLEAQKDPALALALVAALRARGREVRLTLLGDGPMRGQIEREVMRLDLRDHVTIAGYVPHVRRYYEAADLLLMTSRFEGVPAAIGEALAHGLPFVATDCSPWLTSLARAHPALGTVAPRRSPDALAQAVVDRMALPYPDAAQIEAGIGRHRLGRAADDYLDLFDALARDRRAITLPSRQDK